MKIFQGNIAAKHIVQCDLRDHRGPHGFCHMLSFREKNPRLLQQSASFNSFGCLSSWDPVQDIHQNASLLDKIHVDPEMGLYKMMNHPGK